MTDNQDLISHSEGVPGPISKLTKDLLWDIFLINTDNTNIYPWYHGPQMRQTDSSSPPPPRPLHTTRISSQVCSEWRDILLASPSIWSRLIDFFSFNTKFDNYWRDEVISRSGTSLLWVVGGYDTTVSYQYSKDGLKQFGSFFLKFVTKHWERIEKLCIAGWFGDDFSILCRPAPNLKVFQFTPARHRLCVPDSKTIFAGHAPRLHSFRVKSPKSLRLSIDWMANIRDLSLSLSFGGQFNHQCVSEVLQSMYLLEVLELNISGMPAVSTYHSPSVRLPHLHTLKLDACLEFARNIQPGPGCFVHIHEHRAHIISNIVNEDALTRLYRNYSDVRSPQFMVLTQTKHKVILRSSQFSQGNARFEIELTHNTGLDVLVHCLEAFISPQFQQVRRMYLSIHNWYVSSITVGHPGICAAFKKFASSFTSLDSISVDGNTLSILLHEELASSSIFPRLRYLTFNTNNFGVEYLIPFIDLRRKLGVPISILDLTLGSTAAVISMCSLDLDALDGNIGMIIYFRRKGHKSRKYECGRGHAEIQKFADRCRYLK